MSADAGGGVLEVLAPGPLCTVQDLGRTGLAALGVGGSGAADLPALRLANRLVGNPPRAAALELTLGGLRARVDRATTVALTGAPAALRVGGRAAWSGGPVPVGPGELIEVAAPRWGLRSYLAVRGGIAVPEVLGSRATDLLAGLGPAVVAAGDRLPLGAPGPAAPPGVDLAPAPEPQRLPTLELLPGPRLDWFTAAAAAVLAGEYTVTPDSNRIALRLAGPTLERAPDHPGELPPEGLVPGAVQVPPDGRPVLFLADHPVTGGYPVIAVCRERDLAVAAQLVPGRRLRLRWARSGNADRAGSAPAP